MNRRSFLGRFGPAAAATVTTFPLVVMQTGCGSTKQLAKWTGIAIDMLTQLSPILNDMGATGIVALVAKALPIAQKLKKAFEDNDHVSALVLFNNLVNPQTGIVVQIADAIGVLQGPKRQILLGLLATASVMFRLIATHIREEVPTADAAQAAIRAPESTKTIMEAAREDKLEATFAAVRF